ncbi:SLC13 family permease [Halohasta litchfieldiae]|nr:SLC13 family permease [Halohasta litchfieldiae]
MPPVTTGMVVVFAVILLALLLFVTEPVPIDITAIALIVVLIVLEPWTTITPVEGLSGFASSATITVLAMFILSEGIRRTGVVEQLGDLVVDWTKDSPLKQLGAVVGISGGSAGFINNTPVVAVMIPMAIRIAKRTNSSPSTLLMPISFASMMGGTLTLIGTSTNILASDVWDRVGGAASQPFSMFEFTTVGLIVLAVGTVYLLTVGRYLTPERIKPQLNLTEEFEMAEYLTEVVVREESPLIDRTVRESLRTLDVDIDIVHLVRDGKTFGEPLARKELNEGDILLVRTDRETLMELIDTEGVDLLPQTTHHDADFETDAGTLIEVVVLPGTNLIGETLASLNFRGRYDATVLAIRRGSAVIRQRMDHTPLRGGDTLLLEATDEAIQRLVENRAFVVAQESEPTYRRSKTPLALGIVAAVVAVAGAGLLPIVVSALAGVVAMVLTGCLKPTEIYDAVDWNVIFLLAGVIPLGIAMEQTGAAEWLAALVVAGSTDFAPLLILGVFYLLTSLLTNLVSNNASVVLMIPVAFDVATTIGANAFAFVLAVTFAASTAFITPVGYQTNLMVYGPGGYRFSDFFRVGAPLQLLLAVVTTLSIGWIYGV